MYQRYKNLGLQIPQKNRELINKKIVSAINNGQEELLAREEVYNVFTGKGGLHGLEFEDFNNFHAYTDAKKEIEKGQFFTPHELSKFLVETVKPKENTIIGDLTCGMGNFFNYIKHQENVYGIELDQDAYKIAKYLYPKANIEQGDVRGFNPDVKFDFLFNNPPFNLNWRYKGKEYQSQMFIMEKSYELLKAGGILAIITPESFLKEDFSNRQKRKSINEMFSFLGQVSLSSKIFKSVGVDNFETKIMYFQKRSKHIEAKEYNNECIQVNEFDSKISSMVHSVFLEEAIEVKEKLVNKLLLEDSKEREGGKDFLYQVKKKLYAIKTNPKLMKKHGKAKSYVARFYEQEMPEGMDYSEWQKTKITEKKVLSYLNRIIKSQHIIPEDKVSLVKTSDGLRLKAYSRKSLIELNKKEGVKEISFTEMVKNNNYPFEDKSFFNLLKKKRKDFELTSKPLSELKEDKSIKAFLDDFRFKSKENTLKFTDIQKNDLNKIFQKEGTLLNWQQGSGKTLAAIAWKEYFEAYKNKRFSFVVSTAQAINLTWEPTLNKFGFNNTRIESLEDINKVKRGDFVLVTLGMLRKYQKQIKELVWKNSKKVSLIFDESDEITNPKSKTTKAVLNVFRSVRANLPMTGTTTRNNATECYSQLELLYNNSYNMICECEYVYKETKEGIAESLNKKKGSSFPAYRGVALFKSCFNPVKSTVFGAEKNTQDIFNADKLKKLLNKTIITRTFREISSVEYDIIPHTVEQQASEKALYGKLMEEYHKFSHYYKSTGDAKKDSMLKIFHQIRLMIKATSVPHYFDEYISDELPNKSNYIMDMVRKREGKRVAIGVVYKDSAFFYEELIKKEFPNRKLFLITGDVGFKQRKEMINEFDSTEGAILVSTQGALKSSINIPNTDEVIIESLPWNFPRLEQFYFRFIRFNSKNDKNIHIVAYRTTIEQNIIALLMSKEIANDFVKTGKVKSKTDIFNELGFDLDATQFAIKRIEDEKGVSSLSWGRQKIS